MIHLCVLGPIGLADSERGEISAVLAQPKRVALLAYLAVSGAAFVRRDQLLAMFWPELDDAHARAALNQAARFLRQQLGPAVLVSRGSDEIAIDPAALWCDATAFREAAASERWSDALALYRDHLLPGFHFDNAAGFEEWLERERARLRGLAAEAARASSRAKELRGDVRAAVSDARRAVELSDFDEGVVRELLVLLDRAGDRVGAARAYAAVALRLREDYGAEPSPETQDLIELIRNRRSSIGDGGDVGADVSGVPAGVPHASTPGLPEMAASVDRRPSFMRRGYVRYTLRVGAAGVVIWIAIAAAGAMGFGPAASLRRRGRLPPRFALLADDFIASGVAPDVALGVHFVVRAAIEHSPTIRYVSREGAGLSAALHTGGENAPAAILSGKVSRRPGAFDVELRLASAANGVVLAAESGSATSVDDLIPLTDRLTRRVRRTIGESWTTVHATPPVTVAATRSMTALALFAQSFETSDFQVSIALVESAVKADSEFALAWHRLRNLYINSGTSPAARDSATIRAFRYRARLHPTDRWRVEEKYYLFVGDRAKAIEADERVLASGDSNAATLSQLGELARSRRDLRAGERYARAALARSPNALLYVANLAGNLVDVGRLDEADSVLRDAAARQPASGIITRGRVRILYSRGDLEAYERALDSLRTAPDSSLRRDAARWRRDYMLTRGRIREWALLRGEIGALNRSAQPTVTPGDALEEPLVAYWVRRDTAGLAKHVQQAIADRKLSPPELLAVGSFFATIHRSDLGRGFLSDFDAESDSASRRRLASLRHRLRGDILRSEGRFAESLAETRRGDMLPDGPANACAICLYASLGDTFDRAGMADSARVMYERYVLTPGFLHVSNDPLHLARILERLGQLYEAHGERERAIETYARFVKLWSGADAELQPRVSAARRRIEVLARR